VLEQSGDQNRHFLVPECIAAALWCRLRALLRFSSSARPAKKHRASERGHIPRGAEAKEKFERKRVIRLLYQRLRV
jgi:hypothetical protein